MDNALFVPYQLIDLRIEGLNAFALANRMDGKLRRIMFLQKYLASLVERKFFALENKREYST